MLMTSSLPIIGVAFVISVMLTPLVRALALRVRLVDRPDGRLKTHTPVIPVGGGVAVLLATSIAIAVVLVMPTAGREALLKISRDLVGLLVAAVLLCAVGLADDRWGLRGRQKLLGQACAALVLVASGLLIRSVQIFGCQIELGLLAVPFTLFWMLGAINALNLIDGIDGLAASVGIILSLTAAAMALGSGHQADCTVALAMAGALLGFLCFNFPPATIFLGDAGSMLIGLVAGALVIRNSSQGPATVALAAPICIWAIPIFDSATAILRRKLAGRSIYTRDRAHLHHRLLRRGLTDRQTLGWIAFLCTCTAFGALASVYVHNELVAVLCVLAVVGTLIVTRIFGDSELLLLTKRLMAAGASLVTPARNTHQSARHECIRLQGSGTWEEIWKLLADSAERLNMNSMRLKVHCPSSAEGYHASWEQPNPNDAEPADLWRTEIPLVAHNRTVGRLVVTGRRTNGSVCTRIGQLSALLQSLESRVVVMAEENYDVASIEDRSSARRSGWRRNWYGASASWISSMTHASTPTRGT